MGVQFQKGYSTVDGNYGFGDGCFAPDTLDPNDSDRCPVCSTPPISHDFTTLPGASDYLVHVGRPGRRVRQAAVQGHPRGGHQHRQR